MSGLDVPNASRRKRKESSPKTMSASGSGCWRVRGSLAHRVGAELSVTTYTLVRVVHGRRTERHRGTHYRTISLGTAGPAGPDREQGRRWRKYWHGGGAQLTARRLHNRLRGSKQCH